MFVYERIAGGCWDRTRYSHILDYCDFSRRSEVVGAASSPNLIQWNVPRIVLLCFGEAMASAINVF
jgi:hypothetical protein